MTSLDERTEERARLRSMRKVSLLEGSTLLLLIFVAALVPFGAFVNERRLARREALLTIST